MSIVERILKMKEEMKKLGLKAYIIPSSDPHLSECVAPHWASREYFSGFDGSAGTLLISEHECGLWTDGRYFIQAEAQLSGTGIKLFKMGQPEVPTIIDYLSSSLEIGDVLGCDGKIFSVSQIKSMKKVLQDKGIEINHEIDLVDYTWLDRPAIPDYDVFIHKKKYTGYTAAEKIERVRKELVNKRADGYVITLLGSLAWLFNIRSEDIPFDPMVIAYGLILKEDAYLFINPKRLSSEVVEILNENHVKIRDYQEIETILAQINTSNTILYDPQTMNYWLYDILENNEVVSSVESSDIVTELKAIKNDIEIANIHQAQIKDGCALVEAIQHVYELIERDEKITEYDISEVLERYRRCQPNNYGSSFEPIVAYGSNAAMMHYHPTKENGGCLEKKGFLLIDSGGQYLDGTTDITRTFVMGPVTEEEKKHYTLVLKAHIGLSRVIFKEGCTGANLDVLSRQFLWSEGLDYRCGTGHGVAFFGAVHEGPQGFGLRASVPFQPGMMITNEPGIYEEGHHGVRIENTLLVVNDQKTEYGQFYKFEVVSYFPIDTKAVIVDLLSDEELKWLNDYHQRVREMLSPSLSGKSLFWLIERTIPLVR